MNDADGNRVVRDRSGYSVIANKCLADKSLSLDARGMLALLLTFSDGWVFRRNHLLDICNIGRDKYNRIMGELKAAGYVKISRRQDQETGQFSGYDWHISDKKIHRRPENPSDGLPCHLSNNNYKGLSHPKTVEDGEVVDDLDQPSVKNNFASDLNSTAGKCLEELRNLGSDRRPENDSNHGKI